LIGRYLPQCRIGKFKLVVTTTDLKLHFVSGRYEAFRHGPVELLLKLLSCSFDLWLALPKGLNTIPDFVVLFVGKELIGEGFGIIGTLGEVHVEGAREKESAQESNVCVV